MHRFFSFFLALLLTVMSVTPVFAHATGPTELVDASDYVKQAIVFLDGIQDTNTAQMDINNAMVGVGNGQVDQKKLAQALDAVKSNNIEQAKTLLAESLGKDPKNATELSYHPNFQASPLNTVFMVLGVVLILFGVLIVVRVKAAANTMSSLPTTKATHSV